MTDLMEWIDEELVKRQLYSAVRAEHPTARALDVWDFINCPERHLTFEQFMCKHEWSSGYDDSDHEVAVYCVKCNVSGDI